ncbi:STAS domain-containing protein [Nocardia sp. NPDC059691]|uniref:STAS domain-containing protein n=1 Tax=Nocardia sp. NPDC059691 TaxID=3346908 RepID=UPI0036C4F2B0
MDPALRLSRAAPGPSTLRTSRICSPPGLRCAGSVDFTTRETWREAVSELTARDHDVHLDLSGLSFIDTYGTSILVEAATRSSEVRRIVVHRPPAMMLRVLAVFWPSLQTIEVVHT